MAKLNFLLICTIILIIVPLVNATPNIEIEKIDKGSTIISELTNPATFDFIIYNKGPAEKFEIYSLVGVSMGPKGYFDLKEGKNRISVTAYPNEDLRKRTGFLNFDYEIKGIQSGIIKDRLLIKIVPLKEAIEVIAIPLNPSESESIITIKNKENTNLDNIELEFKSMFFESQKTISLKPYEQINITIPVTKEKIKKLSAGPYIIETQIKKDESKEQIESVLDYLEEEGISVEKKIEGIIFKKTTITKMNRGNTNSMSSTEIKKDAVSRLFTVNSPEPSEIQREGLFVKYIWNKELSPDDSFIVESTTNYLFPLIIIILIIVIVLLVKMYTQTATSLRKRVSLVKTRGGEFALKVTIHVKAKKHSDRIQIVDSLPVMTKLYEQFTKQPSRIDHQSGKLYWNIDKLNAGEERIFSYIIYSKLNVIGRFELPAAVAVFEAEGKTQEVFSNKAFFVSEKTKN